MTDVEIIKIAKHFVKGLLGNRSTTDMCYAVCYPLHAYLCFCKIECKLTEGDIVYEDCQWHHFWITLSDGRIIDPTANQFVKPDNKKMRNIWLRIAPQYYKPYTKDDYNRKIREAIKQLK